MSKHRFLDSDVKDEGGPEFSALGSQSYKGLEIFPNPGCHTVEYKCDEIVGVCPITGNPDYYVGIITLIGSPNLIESKSLKLWFTEMHKMAMYGKFGYFCESLAVWIRDRLEEVLNPENDSSITISVYLRQKSRGGISIKASAST